MSHLDFTVVNGSNEYEYTFTKINNKHASHSSDQEFNEVTLDQLESK